MINYWISIDSEIYVDALDYISDPEGYTGSTPSEDIDALLKGLHDPKTVLNLFKPYNGQYLFTVYVSDEILYAGLKMKYSNSIELGGWQMAGIRTVELHEILINFMPDTYDEDGVASPATEITQVNLLSGQAERDLT